MDESVEYAQTWSPRSGPFLSTLTLFDDLIRYSIDVVSTLVLITLKINKHRFTYFSSSKLEQPLGSEAESHQYLMWWQWKNERGWIDHSPCYSPPLWLFLSRASSILPWRIYQWPSVLLGPQAELYLLFLQWSSWNNDPNLCFCNIELSPLPLWIFLSLPAHAVNQCPAKTGTLSHRRKEVWRAEVDRCLKQEDQRRWYTDRGFTSWRLRWCIWPSSKLEFVIPPSHLLVWMDDLMKTFAFHSLWQIQPILTKLAVYTSFVDHSSYGTACLNATVVQFFIFPFWKKSHWAALDCIALTLMLAAQSSFSRLWRIQAREITAVTSLCFWIVLSVRRSWRASLWVLPY